MELQALVFEVLDQAAHPFVVELGTDQDGHLLADAGDRLDLLLVGCQQRIDVAEALGEVTAGDLPDLLDPKREENASEGPLLRRLDRCEQVAGGDLAEALERDELLLAQAVEVCRRVDQAVLLQQRHLLLA